MVKLLSGLSALCVALLIIKIPECGIVGMLFFLPFLPTKALAALMIYIACSYFIKLIAGRRTLRFETLDWWVLLLMVLYFLGGIFSSNVSLSLGPMCMILCFMFGYFAVVNLIRSIRGIRIAIHLKNRGDTEYKVSMRAKGDANVCDMCKALGGGGHEKAAGCTVFAKTPQLAEQAVLRTVAAQLGKEAPV